MMNRFNPSYYMLVPTMACQASCRYCFAKKEGMVMDMDTVLAAMDLIEVLSDPDRPVKIVFHGGEPLLAGPSFYEKVLPLLRRRFGVRLRLAMQSNLWALNGPEGERLLELLSAYNVSVGTSLDGDREMCDSQRGEGYYDRTCQAMERLREYGIHAGTICTFGKDKSDLAGKVFREARSGYSIHGAVPSIGEVRSDCGIHETLPSIVEVPTGCSIHSAVPSATDTGNGQESLAVSVSQMEQILLDSYEAYAKDLGHARISTIDSMAAACVGQKGTVCTFKKCLGQFAAIGPDGSIYSCQRFNGIEEFCLGNVHDHPSEADLLASSGYRRLKAKQDGMEAVCGDCPHIAYCNGGCLYSAFAAEQPKDPYCQAYRAVFDRISVDAALEMAEEMKRQLAGEPLQAAEDTPVLCMAGRKDHPYDRQCSRDRLLDAVERGKAPGDSGAFLKRMKKDIFQIYCMNRLPGVFLNLTYECPLRCSHCSANAGHVRTGELEPAVIAAFVREAISLGVKGIEFTGGEPFYYPGFDELMELLAGMRRNGTRFILRSSFGFDLEEERLARACMVFDKIIVSVDGGEDDHDRRRGPGTYRQTVENLKKAVSVQGRRASIALWTVLSRLERMGREETAVRKLAGELGIREMTFRGLFPLGRSSGADCPDLGQLPARVPSHFTCRTTCGIDNNISVEPDGTVYPCYAWKSPEKKIGNIAEESFETMLGRGTLFEYRLHTVDDNPKCAACDVRYLCGGICKAWLRDPHNIDSDDFQCYKYDYYKRMSRAVTS